MRLNLAGDDLFAFAFEDFTLASYDPHPHIPAPGPGMTRCVSIIVAMSRNGVIGDHGRIPWHLPAELQRFSASPWAPHRDGAQDLGIDRAPAARSQERDRHPQPGLRSARRDRDGHSLRAAIAICLYEEEVFVIGGAEVFREALPIANRIYLTVVDAEVPGDTVMPEIDFNDWQATDTEAIPADDRNPFAFNFTRYECKREDAA